MYVLNTEGEVIFFSAFLLVLLPLAWVGDKFVSVPDPKSLVGGRKPVFSHSMVSMVVNTLTRLLLFAFLDILICSAINMSHTDVSSKLAMINR